MRILAIISLPILAVGATTRAASHEGLLGCWVFDEGSGQIAKDQSGRGLNARIVGTRHVPRGGGFALAFDGAGHVVVPQDKALDALGRPGTSYSIELWFSSTGKGDQSITEKWPGGGYPWAIRGPEKNGTIAFALYDPKSGKNPVIRAGDASLKDGNWHHLAAVRDARSNRLLLYLDGMLAGQVRDTLKDVDVSNRGPVFIGTRTAGSQARFGFQGRLDEIRIYGRALTAAEVRRDFKRAAGAFGIDTTWFSRLRLTPYYYYDRGRAVVELDYRGLLPLPRDARIAVELKPKGGGDSVVIEKHEVVPAIKTGLSEVAFSLGKLKPGAYRVRATVTPKGVCPVEQVEFSYPAPPVSVVSPAEQVAGSLPVPAGPIAFEVKVHERGGFEIIAAGESFPFESWLSYPHGEYNLLLVSGKPPYKTEPSWSVKTRQVSPTEFEVVAGGDYYTVKRRILVRRDHVKVEDTFTNNTDQDLGILVYNHLDSKGKNFQRHFTAGYEDMGRKDEQASPSVFAAKKGIGFGLLPLDDVSIVQSVLYTEPEFVGIGTEKFALGPKKSYTLEWAVYPNATGDYYDFINAVRRNEDRIGTIDGGFAFISKAPFDRRQVPTKEFVAVRNIKYGAIHCLSGAADDPEVSIEGIEFMDFPKERALLKKQIAAIHEKFPGLKVFFHVAHSLYATTNPDRFADSKVIQADGTQAVWGDENYRYMSKRRQEEGWRWYIYYPTPGNSFHDALLKSVDVMMDEIGADGAFMDGFMWGYRGRWTYDRWDGHSAEIDKKTKTIKRKMASVLLLSQPSLIEFCRKIRDKGGVVVANNSVLTRTIAKEKYLIHDKEVHSGPYLHLAPTCTALANPGKIHTEKDIYLDALDKLSWGMLFFYYQEGRVTHESLPARMFPMTFQEIRSGLVKGPERIVTMHSGVYGWPGRRDLHLVYHYDARGARTSHDFITTVDQDGVRTEVKLEENESAVVEPVPISLSGDVPVNLMVVRYDPEAIQAVLNGEGKVQLTIRNGALAITPGAIYRVKTDVTTEVVAGDEATLVVPLALRGLTRLEVAPAR